MDKDTTNIILGAILGLSSSLLTVLITNYFQWKREERERNWKQEDRNLDRRLATLSQKIIEARKFLDKYFDLLTKISGHEKNILLSKKPNEYDDEYLDISSEISAWTKDLPNLESLVDPEFQRAYKHLIILIIAEQKELLDLGDKISKNEEIIEDAELSRIWEFYSTGTEIIRKIMKRLDEFSGFN